MDIRKPVGQALSIAALLAIMLMSVAACGSTSTAGSSTCLNERVVFVCQEV
jgi:hypothetical protein